MKGVDECLKTEGVSLINGGFRSGKTTVASQIINCLLKLKNPKVREETSKTYTIAELLANPDSEDEDYDS